MKGHDYEISIIEGNGMKAICLNGFRIAGSKIYGGGKVTWKSKTNIEDIKNALDTFIAEEYINKGASNGKA